MTINFNSFEETDPHGELTFCIGDEDDFYCFDYGLSDDRREILLHAVINCETGSWIQDAEPPTVARLCNAVAEAQRLVDQAVEWMAEGNMYGNSLTINHDTEGWNQDPQYFVRCVAECVASIEEDRPANHKIPRIVKAELYARLANDNDERHEKDGNYYVE